MTIKYVAILFLFVCPFLIFDKEKINAEQPNISIDKSMEVYNSNDSEKEEENSNSEIENTLTLVDDNTPNNNVAAQPIVVPFVVENNSIILKVNINGIKDTLNFVFGTGETICSLDSTFAAKNKIEPHTEQEIIGESGGKIYRVANIEELQANGLKLSNVNTLLEKLDDYGLETPIDGFIGRDILLNYVTKIDYDKKEFTFYNDISEVETLYKNELALNLDVRIPQIPLKIKLKSGEEFDGYVFMITSSSNSFSLNSNITRNNNLLDSFNPKIHNLVGEREEYKSTLHSLNFNNKEHFDVPVDIPLATEGIHALDGIIGILGNGVTKRYNWIFDYKNNIAYYVSNKLKDEKFDYRCTDFYIEKEDQKLFFKSVQKNSVAYKKGIKDGIEIKSINGYGIEDYTTIRKLLYKEDIKLKIKYLTMDGKKKKITIKTKRKI